MTPLARALSSALLHFVWQGVVVALVLSVVLVLLRRRSAQARYVASCAALAIMAVSPVVTMWAVYRGPAAVTSNGGGRCRASFDGGAGGSGADVGDEDGRLGAAGVVARRFVFRGAVDLGIAASIDAAAAR